MLENDHSEVDEGGSATNAAPRNVWLQRSAGKTSTLVSTDDADVVTENASSSVIVSDYYYTTVNSL